MTIAQISDMPGLATGAGFFERGYATGDAAFPKARVRFTPRQTDPGVAGDMNIAAAPIAVCVAMSVSLVDDAGAVLHVIPGRGLVFDARSHSWQADTTTAFDPEPWLLSKVSDDVGDALIWAKGLTAAASSGLIAAVVAPVAPTMLPPPPPILTVPQYYALFTADEQAALNASDDAQIKNGIAALQIVTSVNLADATVVAGLDHMVALEVLTADRAARIKAGQPPLAPVTTQPAA